MTNKPVKKTQTLWWARNESGSYRLYKSKPSKDADGCWSGVLVDVYCPGEVHELTPTMELLPGECVKLRKTLLKNGYKIERVNNDK